MVPDEILRTPGPSPDVGTFGVHELEVALSGDTLAIPSIEFDEMGDVPRRSLVYIFVRKALKWTQQGFIVAAEEGTLDPSSSKVSLSGDTLAVGTPVMKQGSLTRIVRIFVRSGATWTEQANVIGSNTVAEDLFATAVALSGGVLAVGAFGEDSKATGVNGDQGDGAPAAGAVYLFLRNGTMWEQRAYIKASNTDASDVFGLAVALSGDTLVVGAQGEASGVPGINAAAGQDDNTTNHAGAIYIFR